MGGREANGFLFSFDGRAFLRDGNNMGTGCNTGKTTTTTYIDGKPKIVAGEGGNDGLVHSHKSCCWLGEPVGLAN